MVGYCTHGNKASNSIKFGEIVDQLRNYLGIKDTSVELLIELMILCKEI